MNRLRVVTRLPANALIFVIELYRTYVSPTRMPVCRFTPTCSEYAVTALRTRGLVVGLGLTVVRLAKCAPWHPGGWDPVPESKRAAAETAPPRLAHEPATHEPNADESSADESNARESDSHRSSRPHDEAAEHKSCKGSPRAVTGDTTDGST
ncbi:membrane protein insertion efficiency factor YidD [Nocardia veterana]|uniref:Putative membrane protein insertion efficiency factor n=1 Tax=Nocardia veterana TaxID=132249 RepID=A0A7X6RHE8_9NOCA|nr:membrane protein insertion efficiency factor YidD [Nocardia veterana]NKY85459.1 membrane protein insertion efficiency factor YidD [Nocardia veterana]